MSKTIISLTAIPPRFPFLGETLESLRNQTAKIDEIRLNIPESYRRFEFDPANLPIVPEGVVVRMTDTDLGPATKILPTVRDNWGEDAILLFCDDDKVYDPNWAQRLLAAHEAHPNCAIVEEGGDIRHNSNHNWHGTDLPRAPRVVKDWKYRLKRAASLGRWKPRKSSRSGYVDILEGWGGVLVRPEFFTEAAFDIPDALWMIDDIWLSGQLALNGVPIWLTKEQEIRTEVNSNDVGWAALRKQTVEGLGRTELNQNGIDHFRDVYGIWGKAPAS